MYLFLLYSRVFLYYQTQIKFLYLIKRVNFLINNFFIIFIIILIQIHNSIQKGEKFNNYLLTRVVMSEVPAPVSPLLITVRTLVQGGHHSTVQLSHLGDNNQQSSVNQCEQSRSRSWAMDCLEDPRR